MFCRHNGAVIGPRDGVGGGGENTRFRVCQFNQENDDNTDATLSDDYECRCLGNELQ